MCCSSDGVLVALGIPVLTADYDLWIDADDIAVLEKLEQGGGTKS